MTPTCGAHITGRESALADVVVPCTGRCATPRKSENDSALARVETKLDIPEAD